MFLSLSWLFPPSDRQIAEGCSFVSKPCGDGLILGNAGFSDGWHCLVGKTTVQWLLGQLGWETSAVERPQGPSLTFQKPPVVKTLTASFGSAKTRSPLGEDRLEGAWAIACMFSKHWLSWHLLLPAVPTWCATVNTDMPKYEDSPVHLGAIFKTFGFKCHNSQQVTPTIAFPKPSKRRQVACGFAGPQGFGALGFVNGIRCSRGTHVGRPGDGSKVWF